MLCILWMKVVSYCFSPNSQSVVVTVNIKLALESQYWTWVSSCVQFPRPHSHTILWIFFHSQIHHVTVWGSIFTWFLYVVVYSHFWPTFPIAVEMVGQEVSLYRSFTFYYLFILAPFVATLPDLLKTM